MVKKAHLEKPKKTKPAKPKKTIAKKSTKTGSRVVVKTKPKAAKQTTKKTPAKKTTKKKATTKKAKAKKPTIDKRLLVQVPKKFGRPKFKVTAKVIEKTFVLACKGLADYQIAAGLGIHRDTLIEKKKEYSDFSDAIREGRGVAGANMVNSMFEMGINGNFNAAKYWLNNKDQENWRDKREFKIENDLPREISQEEMEKMGDDDLEKILNSENVVLMGEKRANT